MIIRTIEGVREWRPNDEGTRGVVVGDSYTLPPGTDATATDEGVTIDGPCVTFTTPGPHAVLIGGARFKAHAWSSNAFAFLETMCGSPHALRHGAPARAILQAIACDGGAHAATLRARAVAEADTHHGGLASASLGRYGLARRLTDSRCV